LSRVLVTGASGFIGRHVVSRLAERGHEVHAVARAADPAIPAARWHAVDLLDPDARGDLAGRARAEMLLHLAWCADPATYRESPDNLAWTEASLELLRAFAAAGGSRAVLVGSVFEYDWAGGICAESTTALRPGTLYGTCKSALGTIVPAAGPALGLSCAWARVFWLYGPHEPRGRLVSSVIENLLEGRPASLSAGAQERDFLHVSDVAGALVALLDSEVEGHVNVGSGVAVPVRAVAERIGALVGRPELLSIGERPGGAHEVPLVVAHVERLTREVGFHPAFDLDRGLAHTIEWWRTALARQ
jgi:nucleoside-diphosphate-sugar epimerase